MNRIIRESRSLHARNHDIADRMGFTGYLDFIREDEFINENVLQGHDIYGRKFLSILVQVNGNNVVGTFFRRYIDADSIAYGTCYTDEGLWDDSRVRNVDEENMIIDRIRRLNLGETIIINNMIYRFDNVRKRIKEQMRDTSEVSEILDIILEYL